MAKIEFGQRFGSWVVIGPRQDKNRYLCACTCGKQKLVNGSNLLSGMSRSCGCAGVEARRKSKITHGGTAGCRSLLYGVWCGMRERCDSPLHSSYKHYGERGITICEEWRADFAVFQQWAVTNGYAEGLEIDRRDNNGNYCPENCRFVPKLINARNKSNSHNVTAFAETKGRREWTLDPRCKVGYSTLVYRLNKGWEPERALTEPENQAILHLVTAFGETKHLREWSRDSRCVVGYKTLHHRIKRENYPPELAMTTPEITKEIQQAHGKSNATLIEAFGEKKSIEAWARDPRCVVKAPGLWLRLHKQGLDPETAITRHNRKSLS